MPSVPFGNTASATMTASAMLIAAGLCACAGPLLPPSFAVPAIEPTPVLREVPPDAEEAATAASSTTERPAAVFEVTFDSDVGSVPLKSMRMVMAAGDDEAREVEMVDQEWTLTGTAEAIPGGDRWLVGVSGVSSTTCIVVRMTAVRDGDRLRGWAVIDAGGSATAARFVAEPAS